MGIKELIRLHRLSLIHHTTAARRTADTWPLPPAGPRTARRCPLIGRGRLGAPPTWPERRGSGRPTPPPAPPPPPPSPATSNRPHPTEALETPHRTQNGFTPPTSLIYPTTPNTAQKSNLRALPKLRGCARRYSQPPILGSQNTNNVTL
eukprot:5195142-Pyramimonas_sp.AAC.1